MNTPIRYIKSFSKGQITIPKEFRQALGMGDEAWLKLYLENSRIIAEPVEEKKMSREEWRKKLLTLKTTWFDEDAEAEIYKNRQEIEEKLKRQES